MKNFIRESSNRGKKMPKCMKKAIIEKIEKSLIGNWVRIIGVVLFGKDNDLKKILKNKLLKDKTMKACNILNVIAQTQILRGGETIFEVHETQEYNKFSVEVLLHGNKISSYSMNSGKKGKMEKIKGDVRAKVVEKVFDYFINI